MLYVGHWLLILLIPVYIVWVPFVIWITSDKSLNGNDKAPTRNDKRPLR